MTAKLTSIDATLAGAFPGLSSGIGGHDFLESRINAMSAIAAVTGHTITAADDTDFTITIQGVAITVHSAATGATAATIRDQFIAAVLADPRVNTLVTPSASGNTVRLTEIDPAAGTVTVTSGAGIAQATVTAHTSATGISPGIFVTRATAISGAVVDGRAARLPTSGDTAAAIIGVVEAAYGAYDQAYTSTDARVQQNPPQFAPGDSMSVKKQGSIFVIAETAMAEGAAVHVRIIASGVNNILGAVRNAADSSNSVQLTTGVYSTGTNFTFGALLVAELQLNLPA